MVIEIIYSLIRPGNPVDLPIADKQDALPAIGQAKEESIGE